MYRNIRPIRNTNYLLLTLMFAFVGCQEHEQNEILLDSDLKTHFYLIQEGKTGSARVRLRQFMNAQQVSAQPLFLMGLSYHQEKKYTKAVEWFEKSARFDTNQDRYPPTWHFLGWAYYYLGDVGQSKLAFEQFLRFQPNEGDSLFALGLLAMDAGNFIEAEDLYRKSISSQKDNPKGQAKAMARLGDVFSLKKNMSSAREMYLQSVELDPDLYEAWYHLSRVQNRLHENELATIALEKYKQAKLRLNPSTHKTRFPE